MSFARMHAQNPPPPTSKNYLTGLIATIDHYIHQRSLKKKQSTGIDRAKCLKASLVNKLVTLEGLSEQQILWRIYDYLFLPQGAYPLETSKDLRKAILENLCGYLAISKQMLEEKERELTASETKFYFQCDKEGIHQRTRQILISNVLTSKAAHREAKVPNNFVIELSKIFTECNSLRQYRQIQDQWLGVEGLNEHQLLCRLSENIQISLMTDQGLLGGNDRLRARIAWQVCQHLSVNESVIHRELMESLGGRFYISSPFGPVYNNHNPDRVMIDLRLQHMNAALKLRATTQYVVAPFEKGEVVEMQKMRSK